MDLARASLTVDLTEAVGSFLGRYTGLTPDGRAEDPTIPLNVRPSPSSNLVIAIVTESGTSGVDTDYIDGYRRYGSRVSSEYSFGYISNRDYWTVLYDLGGSPFVHFSIELDPEDMTFRRNEDGSLYETRLRVDIEVRDRRGGLVAIPSRDPYIQLSAEQIEMARALPVSYQDSFPLIPGAYQIAVTLRNLAGEHFTVAERNLSVTALPEESPALGGVAVGYDVVAPQESGSFAAHGQRVLPAGRAYFPRGGTLHAFAQLIDREDDARVQVSLSGPSGVVERYQVRSSGGVATQAIALDDVAPGSYSILFELIGSGGEALVTKSSAFDVVDKNGLLRPALIYRNVVSDPDPVVTAMTMSDQFVARGQLVEAERVLRAVLDVEGPRADVVGWKLASVLLYTAQGAEALELLLPLETSYPDQAEVIEGLGFAYYLVKDYENALPRLEYAMALRPPDISVLNATGDCYEQLGRADKAREMFELSLSVNPNQEGVRSRLSELPAQ
jgi:tetratricopeptide (TPR) repeat protein